MPNDVVSRAIDAVCAGDHLTADHASAVLAEIMEGRDRPDPDRRLPDRPAGEGGDGLRAGRPGADDALAGAAPVHSDARRPGRHRRHRRRPLDLQRLDHRGAGRRRAPAAPVAKHGNRSNTSKSRLGRPAGGARGRHRARRRGRSAAASTRSASASCSPPATTRRWPTSVPARKALGRAHDLQLPRPADQPGGRDPAAARRRRPPLPGDDRRGAGRARQRAGAGRRAEDGLDELSLSSRRPG